MSFKVLIVDDESSSRDNLKALLEQMCPEIVITGSTGKVEEAVELVYSTKPEVLFLDVHLGDRTGFDLLDILYKYNCDVVFTTASEDFARKAFQYGAVNYLTKPIDYKELVTCMYRIRQHRADHYESIRTIALSDASKTDFVPLEKIVYLKSNGPYTIFYLEDGKQYTQSKHLKFYEDCLQGNKHFIRVHKSYMVNKRHAKSYRKMTAELECIGNALIPVTINYRKLMELLQL